MKFKLTYSILLLLSSFSALAQSQLKVFKKPEWNIISSTDSRYGSTLQLSNNNVAMIVNAPKVDFAVVTIDGNLNQKWITSFEGFPMAIGKFKDKILVVAATDHSYFKSFTNTFVGYLLDETTGKLVSKKIIYDGSVDFIEEPRFYFAEDGSYFKMSVRLTAMKKKVRIGLPIIGAYTALKVEKDYSTTVDFNFIDFDNQLNASQKTNPFMPDGQTWNSMCGDDGSFIIMTKDSKLGKINVATYISGKREPLKTVSVPVDFYKNTNGGEIKFAGSKAPLVNYFSMMYKNLEKDICLLVAKIDFKTGTYLIQKEVMDKDHIRDLQKSFVPVNKKFNDLDFRDANFLDVTSIKEYNNQLLVSVVPFTQYTQNGAPVFALAESVLLNMYDLQLKSQYHQFLPRTYKSKTGEGSEIAFNQKNDVLRMIANKTGIDVIYAEMDMKTGKMIRLNEVPKDGIKGSYYANTETLWWQDLSFTIPFAERRGLFSDKIDVQFLQLSY
ncbi:hypothetical protein [Pedobacter frigiditerrae]|uniref:hypothetical protein n=1 Tax=Pedobacter frigiditerrae TaxID=2530452 RepID=UPI00292F44DE|nr:hypothetical protein [Pedobacter frigiditerrae]